MRLPLTFLLGVEAIIFGFINVWPLAISYLVFTVLLFIYGPRD